ncbi:MAG: anti-sigma factor family protein [Blastocatellia bacterium]
MTDRKDNFVSPQSCGRKDDLLDYLYGESNGAARAAFDRHLDQCGSCHAELMAFSRVRDELSTWQLGFAPRTEVVLLRRRLELLRELINSFPAWVRGAALAGAAAAIALIALSLANASIDFKGGDFAIQFGASKGVTGSLPQSSEEIEKLVQAAVARQEEKMQQEFRAQMAGLKDQLAAEHQAQLQAVSTRQQAKLQAVRAGLRLELARVERQNRNIRPFFDSDEYAELWSTGR